MTGKIQTVAEVVRTVPDSAHVVGDLKHFAYNDQETGRATANVIIDERGGRESDLLAFEIVVKIRTCSR